MMRYNITFRLMLGAFLKDPVPFSMSPMPNFVKRPSLFFCIENKRSQNHSPRLSFMMAITFLPVLVLEASLSTERSQTSSIGFYRPRHCSGQPIIQASASSVKGVATQLFISN
uniref:Uncharacterized protein n=1 Tax=Gossypium raimondii TaxID=29730 RepID=A0A0D2PP22_GOSRA|nr:hypothetical protein B456_001G087600 [Gossypium raimondii]KJB08539.1 hypothetical protein B456_001G087600 [Gossypium raimondii]